MTTHQQPDPRSDTSSGMDWVAMDRWLVESLADMSRAAIVDIGPCGVHVGDDAPEVDCAQIQALSSGTFIVRLSTVAMSAPLLASHSVPRDALDRWFYDDAFTDCTHGYLMSRSRRRIAEITVAWFRDRCGFGSPDELGCSYTEAVQLPRSAEGNHPVERQGYP
ncbi:hypothetical protein AAFP35_06470 [Gordonia sp. CPCC 206044]|uniref:hypothetical protein n=1 Tax=Gordonia sp. CPCC 206044 TaxID=3140793 RepID=UPI003AF38E07